MVSADRQMLERLGAPIQAEMERFRAAYRRTLESGHPLIDRVVRYMVRGRGKGLRPMLVFLSAKLSGGEVGDGAVRAAVVVELLHDATLVHDDVVDESPARRGLPSLAARFRNKVAVLFGDYMLAHVLTQTLSERSMDWLDILSETARRMARGELVQAARSRSLDMSEAEYLQMAADKTAALFNAACRLGAYAGGLSPDQQTALGRFGESLGVAFQIRDDLLDLFGDGTLGKPLGGDLKQRKLTLPVIAALSRAEVRQARRIRARIRRGLRRSEPRLVAEFVRQHRGDEYARQVMREHGKAALEALLAVPVSPVRLLLESLVDFAMERRI